jgi:hypothetical protein
MCCVGRSKGFPPLLGQAQAIHPRSATSHTGSVLWPVMDRTKRMLGGGVVTQSALHLSFLPSLGEKVYRFTMCTASPNAAAAASMIASDRVGCG